MSLLSPIVCGTEYSFMNILKKLVKKDADGNYYLQSTGLASDKIAPLLLSATIGTTSDSKIILTYNEPLDPAFVPLPTDYNVWGVHWGYGPTGVLVVGNTVEITLAGAAYYGDTIILSYTQPAVNGIRDLAGNLAASFLLWPGAVINTILPCAEYTQVVAAMTTIPGAVDYYRQHSFCKELVDLGLWAKMDYIGLLAVHTNGAGEALLNWKQPFGGGNACLNGTFTIDAFWNKGAGWTIPGTGVAVAAGTTANLDQAVLIIGRYYRIVYTVVTLTGGTVRCMAGTTAGTTRNATGTYVEILQCLGNTSLIIDGVAAFSGTIDNVSAVPWTNAIAYNAPTHTAYQGILFDGATQYINSRFCPSASGVNFTQNSASQILYIRTNINTASRHGTCGNTDTYDYTLSPRYSSDRATIRTNDATTIVSAVLSDGSGMYINTRTAADVNKLYRNGTAIINGTTSSTGLAAHSMYIGAYNDDGVTTGFRADEVALHAYGGGLTLSDVQDFTNCIERYMDAYGTGVIP